MTAEPTTQPDREWQPDPGRPPHDPACRCQYCGSWVAQ